MKLNRFIAGALALAALFALSFTSADAAAVRYKSGGLLTFRTHKAAIAGTEASNYGVDGAGGYADSDYVSAPNAADAQDTSAVWMYPNDFCIPSASDSLPVILIVHNSVAGASGDTIHVMVQPFMGGAQTTAGNFVAVAAAPAATNRVVTGAITAGAVRLFPAGSAAAFAGSETAASTAPLSTQFVPGFSAFRAFRVILYYDGTAAMSGNGSVSVEVLYPTCQ